MQKLETNYEGRREAASRELHSARFSSPNSLVASHCDTHLPPSIVRRLAPVIRARKNYKLLTLEVDRKAFGGDGCFCSKDTSRVVRCYCQAKVPS